MPNCDLCPRKCAINEGDVGFCGVRKCRDGKIVSVTAGLVSGFAVDPIEKKPLNHFFPGSSILSFGSVGCNLACRFCQNWESAKSRDVDRQLVAATPEEIAALVRRSGCESVAFTYNEPIICAEFVMDVARTCRLAGIRTVAVSNGFIADRWREPFFKLMDAVNIDLKSFSDTFYEKFCSGSLEPIRETIRHLAKRTDVWLEVTTLLIPTLGR